MSLFHWCKWGNQLKQVAKKREIDPNWKHIQAIFQTMFHGLLHLPQYSFPIEIMTFHWIILNLLMGSIIRDLQIRGVFFCLPSFKKTSQWQSCAQVRYGLLSRICHTYFLPLQTTMSIELEWKIICSEILHCSCSLTQVTIKSCMARVFKHVSPSSQQSFIIYVHIMCETHSKHDDLLVFHGFISGGLFPNMGIIFGKLLTSKFTWTHSKTQLHIEPGWWFGCHFLNFPILIGFLSSSQLTKSYFSGRGGPGPPTRNVQTLVSNINLVFDLLWMEEFPDPPTGWLKPF